MPLGTFRTGANTSTSTARSTAGISLARLRARPQRPARRGRQPVEAGTCGAEKAAQASVITRPCVMARWPLPPSSNAAPCVRTLLSHMGVLPGEYCDVDAISWGTYTGSTKKRVISQIDAEKVQELVGVTELLPVDYRINFCTAFPGFDSVLTRPQWGKSTSAKCVLLALLPRAAAVRLRNR
jgi:hypothetical protein